MISPLEGIERLRDGNARFLVGENRAMQGSRKLPQDLVSGQAPFAVVLGCSDSRVPVELVFDQGLGDVFVIRVAGNIAGAHEIGSIEYAVDMLGSKLIVVLGHTGCGAVKATLSDVAEHNPGLSPGLRAIVDTIKSAVQDEREVNHAVRKNVRAIVARLEEQSEIIAKYVRAKEVCIVGAVYSLETGLVEFLEDEIC